METTTSTTVPACGVCDHTLQTGDLFCRRCGARQQDLINSPTVGLESSPGSQPLPATASYETGSLPAIEPNIYHPVSGRLVSTLVTSLGIAPAAQFCSPLMRKIILALSLLPIWLIIVFFSPLDAYLAATSVTARRDCNPLA